MTKLRLGFIGVGSMGQCAHLRNYASLPDCEVVALAEPRPELAARVATRYGVPRVYPDHTALLAGEPTLEGLVASQPFSRHGLLLPELLAAGLPVFCEKPLAGTLAAAERIMAAEAAGPGWLMVGYHKRCDPATVYAVREIAALKASGELGALRYVRLLMPPGDWIAGGFYDLIQTDESYPALAHDPPPDDLDEPAFRQFTAFVNYYIHQVNLLRHLLGEPYQVTYADPAGVLLVVQSDSGVTGLLEMAPFNTSVDWQESALIAFERGTITLKLPAPVAINRPGSVEIYRDPGGGVTPTLTVPTLPWDHAMRCQAQAFLAALRGEAPPPCTAAEALLDLQLARDYLRLLTGE
jgi:predicted dehydrogenase